MWSLERVRGAGIRHLNPLLMELKKTLINEANLRVIKLFFSLSLFLNFKY
jgi:hypothetical protein